MATNRLYCFSVIYDVYIDPKCLYEPRFSSLLAVLLAFIYGGEFHALPSNGALDISEQLETLATVSKFS